MKNLAGVLVVVAAVVGCASPAPSPTPTPVLSPPSQGTPPPVTEPPSPTLPAETDVCVPDVSPTDATAVDPCPMAIAAVRNVVAPLGLSIARLVLRPGFFCGLWPNPASPVACFGPFYAPGTAMYGWVSFAGSEKVAAVSARLQAATGQGAAPSPMWVATIEAFEVPPAGWVMP